MNKLAFLKTTINEQEKTEQTLHLFNSNDMVLGWVCPDSFTYLLKPVKNAKRGLFLKTAKDYELLTCDGIETEYVRITELDNFRSCAHTDEDNTIICNGWRFLLRRNGYFEEATYILTNY